MASVILHLIDPSEIDLDWAKSQLNAVERARAAAFVFAADRDRWTRVRAACRERLGSHLGIPASSIEWVFSINDKPSIAGHDLAFNLSHGDTLSALAISPVGPIGVDLELTRRGEEIIEDRHAFCHPDELETLPEIDRGRALIELWTAKEAFLKAVGTGLSLPPDQVCVRENSASGPLAGFESLHLLRPHHPRLSLHTIAIAAPRELTQVDVAD
jgi:4'-phosphopantetheinyl transferase